MKKIYFIALFGCISFAAFAQSTTVTIFSTAALGSYITGTATTLGPGTRTDGNIASGATPIAERGYAVFNLSSIPVTATITSCVIGFYVSSITGATAASGWNTYGYPGNLSAVTVPATLYGDMTTGTSLSTATYGTVTGNRALASTVASTGFIQSNAGNIISICYTSGGGMEYVITGENGTTSTTAPNGAPYLQITYTCPGVSGVAAVATPNPVCVGAPLTLTASGAGVATYSWSGPGGYTGGGINPALITTAASAGVYTLMAYTAGGCGTQATTTYVSLSATPVATISGGPLLFCAGQDVLLSGTAGAGYSYQWYQSGGIISGATNQTYADSFSGSYTVEVGNTSTGCVNTSAPTIVSALPLAPPLTPAIAAGVCVGSYLTLGVDLTGVVTTGLGYQWEVDGISIPGANSSTYTTDSGGIYSCIMTTLTCNDTTQNTTVTENPLPNPVISYSAGTLSTSAAYIDYQWFLNLNAIPGATTYSLIAPEDGAYYVVVTDDNGCRNNSDSYALYNLMVGQVNNADVKIYPNPACTTVHITSAVSVRAVIATIEGNKLIEKAGATDIDINELPNGLYLIMLYNDAGTCVLTDKLVKE